MTNQGSSDKSDDLINDIESARIISASWYVPMESLGDAFGLSTKPEDGVTFSRNVVREHVRFLMKGILAPVTNTHRQFFCVRLVTTGHGLLHSRHPLTRAEPSPPLAPFSPSIRGNFVDGSRGGRRVPYPGAYQSRIRSDR